MLCLYIYLVYLVFNSKSQILKPAPNFSEITIKKAENIIVYENIPLNTEILVAKAFSYEEAYPISYSLIDPDEYFKINSTTGSVTLFSPFSRQKKYQFMIVATDSASIKQSTHLTANVVVISANTQAPYFNDDFGHHVSILEIITPKSVIYDKIFLNDSNSEQSGVPRIFCDSNDPNNSDALLSCSYFRLDFRIKEAGVYQCLVILTKKLDFFTKNRFALSITAEILMKKITTYLIVEVKKREIQPKFSQSTYLYLISYENLFNNTLEVRVLNVDSNKAQNISFDLSDPKNFFKLSNFWCSHDICYQNIQTKNLFPLRTIYKLNITFFQQIQNHLYSTKAEINVIFDYPQTAQKPPAFLYQDYTFFVYENIAPNTAIRNASLTVFEDEPLSLDNSGFYLEVLDKEKNIPDSMFDIVPNFGMGYLVSCFKLKPNKYLDHESGPTKFNLRIRAVSRSNRYLFSFANVTIYVQDFNEHSPFFENFIVSKVLNDPENLNPGDCIITLKAHDEDSNDKRDGLVYNLIGAHQHKFTIDSFGQIKLFRKFDFKKELLRLYNITVVAYDQGGLSNFTNLILYFNITSPWAIDKSNFFCSISSSRSELSFLDFKTFQPELYIPINSVHKLKYFISESVPKLNELSIDSLTGRIFLKSPINSTILNKYSRVFVEVKAYQIQNVLNGSLYLSSIDCAAIIYLKPFDQPHLNDQRPFFLQKYKIQIERELAMKSVPFIKIEAISMNSKNNLPIRYTIIKKLERIFRIDAIQGFIYLEDGVNLENKEYEVTVEATDQSNGLSSSTKILISVTQRFKSTLKCSQDYVIAKIDPDNFFIQNYITQINCSSENESKNSKITFDISSVHKIYNCEGFDISYQPSIGIDSSTGRIMSFKNLSRENFCDASFTVHVQQDENFITIPFKLVLTKDSTSKPPVFILNSVNITYLSEYAHAGSYITTIIAYDPVTFQLIEKYSIVSEISYPISPNRFFKIDSLTGVISLNTLPFVNKVKLIVSATSNYGMSSHATIYIDLSSYFDNFFTNLYLNSKYIHDNVTLCADNFYYDSIYQTKTRCFSQYDLSKNVPCSKVVYSLDYIKDYGSNNLFLIGNRTGNLYLSSSKIDMFNRSEYVLVINAKSDLAVTKNSKDRFIREDQRQLKIFTISSLSKIAIFDKKNYSIHLFSNISNNSLILTLKYESNTHQVLNVSLAQKSNYLIDKYFYLKHISLFNQVQLFVKNSPILLDTSKINFEIQLANSTTILSKVFVQIGINFHSEKLKFPVFTIPSKAGYVLDLDPSLIGILNNTIILNFDVISNTNQIVVYSILNKNPIPFYIDKKSLRIIYPFPNYIYSDKKSYLLFIEAHDVLNMAKNYITIEIRVKLLRDNLPRFEREETSGPISLSIYENASLYQQILDMTNLVYIPDEKFYFYVFETETNKLSETFGVNVSQKFWLQPIKKLNSQLKSVYKLFIYITDTPISYENVFYPSNLNRAFLFVNIKVLDLNETTGYFSQVSKFIILDPIVSLNKKIGQVVGVSSLAEPIYKLIACDLVFNSLIYVDPQFCELFILNKKNGIISANSSNYQTFSNNYFVLKILATFSSVKINTEVYVFIIESDYKSRLVLSDVYLKPSFSLNHFKDDINTILEREANGTIRFEYNEYFISFMTSSDTGLNICFVLIQLDEKIVLNFEESKNIFSKSNSLKSLLNSYSISKIQRCIGEQDMILNQKFYEENGLWKLNSYSIGMLVLVSLMLLATIFSICLLEVCWASFLRQSTLAMTADLDSIDADSNNFLIDD